MVLVAITEEAAKGRCVMRNRLCKVCLRRYKKGKGPCKNHNKNGVFPNELRLNQVIK